MRLDGLARHRKPVANGLIRSSFRHQGEHGALALRQVVERYARTAPDKDRDDSRIDDRAALGDPPNRVGDVVEIHDPILEQIPHPAGTIVQQAQRK